MNFHATAKFEQGVADVDPVAAPATVLSTHMLLPDRSAPSDPDRLYLSLLGTGSETVTVDLYFLYEDGKPDAKKADYITTTARWYRFATGVVITNGELLTLSANIPPGGIIYARRTADSITAGQTRTLGVAWLKGGEVLDYRPRTDSDTAAVAFTIDPNTSFDLERLSLQFSATPTTAGLITVTLKSDSDATLATVIRSADPVGATYPSVVIEGIRGIPAGYYLLVEYANADARTIASVASLKF